MTLLTSAAALLSAGDDVLIERPAYDPLIGACRLMGATVRRFERRLDNGFGIDLSEVRRLVTRATRLIVVTTPHNPSGVAVPLDVLEELASIAAARTCSSMRCISTVRASSAGIARVHVRPPHFPARLSSRRVSRSRTAWQV